MNLPAERRHNVVVAAVSMDEGLGSRILFIKRKVNDRYWPGEWGLLSEHVEPGETDFEALARGLKEEVGMSDVLITKGPFRLRFRDPYQHEQFHVRAYQVVPKDTKYVLDSENERAVWHLLRRRPEYNASIRDGNVMALVDDVLNGLQLDFWNAAYDQWGVRQDIKGCVGARI